MSIYSSLLLKYDNNLLKPVIKKKFPAAVFLQGLFLTWTVFGSNKRKISLKPVIAAVRSAKLNSSADGGCKHIPSETIGLFSLPSSGFFILPQIHPQRRERMICLYRVARRKLSQCCVATPAKIAILTPQAHIHTGQRETERPLTFQELTWKPAWCRERDRKATQNTQDWDEGILFQYEMFKSLHFMVFQVQKLKKKSKLNAKKDTRFTVFYLKTWFLNAWINLNTEEFVLKRRRGTWCFSVSFFLCLSISYFVAMLQLSSFDAFFPPGGWDHQFQCFSFRGPPQAHQSGLLLKHISVSLQLISSCSNLLKTVMD